MENIKYKPINTTPITSPLSKINNVIGNVKNVVFEVFFDDIKIYKRNSDKKIEKTGIVYFRTIDRGEYTNSDLNTILTSRGR